MGSFGSADAFGGFPAVQSFVDKAAFVEIIPKVRLCGNGDFEGYFAPEGFDEFFPVALQLLFELLWRHFFSILFGDLKK